MLDDTINPIYSTSTFKNLLRWPGPPKSSDHRTWDNVYLPVTSANFSPSEPRDSVSACFQPRTALGRKLLGLRRAYVENGGQLLTAEELDQEMRTRRGGLTRAEAHLPR
jgi:hypothetical protein